jgi:hypothetical protein
MRDSIVAALLVSLLAPAVRADEVHLQGGRVIEGATKVEGDRVIVALESGKIALPMHSVLRIERTRPAIEVVRQREASLGQGDVDGLLELANYCREHDLRAKEHELLQRVVRIAPNHEIARRRLGFVRAKEGWITGPDRVRRAEDAALAERRTELEKKRTEIELEQKRAELTLSEAKLERERAALLNERAKKRERVAQRDDDRPMYPSYYVAPYPQQPLPELKPPSGQPAFPINGVRSPHDASFSLPGVREPRTYFGDALRR